jgi:menaquinone-dependent protoporphyrinogen oxidase
LTGINANLSGMGEQSEARLAMLILVLFSTKEGHTRKLAQFAAARLRGCGHEIQLQDAAHPALPDAPSFDAALLLASIHLGRYQRSFIEFVGKNHDALNLIPSAFISVSLSAAGDNPSDLTGIRACVDRLERETLWHPGAVHQAGGAMPFSSYGFFTKLAIRYIVRHRGKIVKTSEDYDLTDYAAVETFIDRFASRALASTQNQGTRHNGIRLRHQPYRHVTD